MPLIIDGYNLLHASGVFPSSGEPATFERARFALLDFLAHTLSPEERAATTIVFDATQAPPGLPARGKHEGITIRFAKGYADADTLIEEMIEKHAAPRTLTIVSSDHRIQRAARRRRATPIDSEIWREQIGRRPLQNREGRDAHSKPSPQLDKENSAHWMKEFGDIDIADLEQQIHIERAKKEDVASPPSSDSTESDSQPNEEESETPFDNPFPPGYGEDLLKEDRHAEDIFPPGFGEGIFDEED